MLPAKSAPDPVLWCASDHLLRPTDRPIRESIVTKTRVAVDPDCMAISSISASLPPTPPAVSKSKSDETLEQLAQEGDPIAIAELKAQQEQSQPQAPAGGASEPGKGATVDQYV